MGRRSRWIPGLAPLLFLLGGGLAPCPNPVGVDSLDHCIAGVRSLGRGSEDGGMT